MDLPIPGYPNPDSPSQEAQLSRAVSAIDLNASLTAMKEKPKICFLQDDQTTSSTPDFFPGKKLLDSTSFDGILTPPVAPDPPPPTPAAIDIGTTDSNLLNQLGCDTTEKTDLDVNQQSRKKKKRKGDKKSEGKKSKNPVVTGFEEYYADSPITPEEYEEELYLYNPAHRKLDSERSNIFAKYLDLGGIEIGANQLTKSHDKETASENVNHQAADSTSTHSKSSKFYNGSDNWVVDFEGVAKGFFSHRIAGFSSIESEGQLKNYCMVIKSFLNYVLYHKVCPEYTTDILAAREIADLAQKELWAIQKISSNLPGDFNLAASILFGGRYKNFWGFRYLDDENDKENSKSTVDGATQSKAEQIFMTAIKICGGAEQAAKVRCSDVFITKTEKKYLEVIEIEHSNSYIIDQYNQIKHAEDCLSDLKPLGAVRLRYWKGTGSELKDCTDDESDTEEDESESEWYWLEDEILQKFFVKLKLYVEIKELNIGMKFIDSFIGLYCSFYTFLPNEKMHKYKEPVLSNKPAPTVDDIDVGNRFQDEIADDVE